MGVGVLGIEIDGTTEVHESARQAFSSVCTPMPPAAQVSIMRLGAARAVFSELLLFVAGELRHERFGNLPGDGIFQLEKIGARLDETRSPTRGAGSDRNQLYGYSNTIAGTVHSAFENILDLELAA